MVSSNHTQFELRNGVVIITFDRDEKLNAFNAAMTAEVAAHLERAQQAGARVVVLRANPGVRVWCAGRDLSELSPGADPADDPMLNCSSRSWRCRSRC